MKNGPNIMLKLTYASQTGASPGARHGLKKKTSSAEPGVALRFAVRYLGSSVGWMDSPGQWSKLRKRAIGESTRAKKEGGRRTVCTQNEFQGEL